jgi:hypothetical protein
MRRGGGPTAPHGAAGSAPHQAAVMEMGGPMFSGQRGNGRQAVPVDDLLA